MRRLAAVLALIFLPLLINACASGPDVRPDEGTKFMTEDEETRFGHYVDAEVTNQFLALENKEITEAVSEIGQKLAKISHRPKLKHTFKVLNSSTINAFAAPGGYVYVTTGLLEELESRDELAAVLAHELGHVSGRHSVRALRSAKYANAALTVVGILAALGAAATGVPVAGDLTQAVGLITTMIVYQGYSRSYESQADRLGMLYARKAGFKPEAMMSVFKKFIKLRKEEGKKESLVILSSHPALEDRIKDAEEYLAKLKEGRGNETN
jgi:predicted Zn-dependent protease